MNIQETDKQYIMNTYSRQDVVIVSGKGAVCQDENGKEYIDFGSGIGVNALGYCDEEWSNAVAEQAKTIQHTSNLYYTKPAVELAKNLCEATEYEKVFFSNSGAEANEGAIKLARKYSIDKYGKEVKRNKILTLVNSFHGRTITTLSATGQEVFHNKFFPLTEGFEYAPANEWGTVLNKLQTDKKICAVMIEFIQGEGGVLPLTPAFVENLFDYCQKNDILVIADEVQTGVGRTGKFLASQLYGVKPNITTLAKGLGGGLPIGAVLADEKTQGVLSYSDHGSTFGGNPVVCAGANVVMRKLLAPGFLDEVAKKGTYIKKQLLQWNGVEAVTGNGLMLGVALNGKKSSDVVKTCVENGLVPLTAKQKVRLLPPLIISYEEIDKGLAILKDAIEN